MTNTTPSKKHLIARYGMPDDCAQAGEVDNVRRAYWTWAAIQAFMKETMSEPYPLKDFTDGDVLGEVVGDLIGDLCHFVTFHGGDPQKIKEQGWHHFICEVGLGYRD